MSTEEVDKSLVNFGRLRKRPIRLKPEQKSGLQPEEIESKLRGNYIFTFGFPGSGKTTFQWMLMNYLMNDATFRAEIKVPNRTQGHDWEGRSIINTWKDQWIEGRFPAPNASAESDVREIEVAARAIAGRKISFDFNFLEMSGELLQQVMPESNSSPMLPPLCHAYFNNPRLKFCVFLMLSPEIERNDQLFACFFAYLKSHFPNLMGRMSIAVIISKPQESLQRLQEFSRTSGSSALSKFSETELLRYLNLFCGETYAIYCDWPYPRKKLLSPFYIGTIEGNGDERRLVEPNFHHTEEIFFWICKQFTGRKPGLTWWQQFSSMLKWE